MTLFEYCEKNGIEIIKDGDNLTVGDYLDLSGTAVSELPDNLTVGGYLDLSGTAVSELPDNLTVGGSLYLRGTAISELPDNLTVGGYLDLSGTAVSELPDNLTVGGSLDLRDTAISELPDNLTVGGNLDLSGTAVSELPDNLTVGGSLDLSGTAVSELPDNLTVGGSIYHEKLTYFEVSSKNFPSTLSWQGGKYVLVDGIFSEVVSRRGKILRVKKIGKQAVTYLVTDGNGRWSHGETLKEAKESLVYKISNRDTSRFSGLSLESTLTLEEAIEAYRVISGACAFGVKSFVESLPKAKKSYRVREIIEITRGHYGSKDFESFFSR